jgi:hypothetical protein
MDFAMMAAAQRNSKFVAYLARERTILRKPNVMRVRRLPATNKAGLFGHKVPVIFVPKPTRADSDEVARVKRDNGARDS